MENPTQIFRFGPFEADRTALELRREGAPVAIDATPLRLLLYFLAHPLQLLTKEVLLRDVWPGVKVGENALSTALMEARSALGDDGVQQQWIRTLRGRGYLFAKPVEGSALPPALPDRSALSGRCRSPAMHFVGRGDELKEAEAKLTGGIRYLRSVAIEGLAGIGKTELALQLVLRLAALGEFAGGIYWFDAETPELTASWAALLGDPPAGGPASLAERCRDAIRALERSRAPALIVLDNVVSWTPAQRPHPLPQGLQLSFLVTTRERNLGGGQFHHVCVDVLSPPHDRELVQRSCGRSFGAELEPLLAYLGGHALALELAGAFLGAYPAESPDSYLRELELHPAQVEAAAVERGAAERTVFQAFRSIWDRLGASAHEAWWLLSFFDPEPVDLVRPADWGIEPEALRRLEALHVLRSNERGHWVMHRLAQAFAQDAFPPSARALELLGALGGQLQHRRSTANELRRVYGRALAISEQLGLPQPRAAALVGLWQTARFRGEWALAHDVAEQLSREQGSSMLACHAVGETAFYGGQIDKASEWLARAQELSERASADPATGLTPMQPLVSLSLYSGMAAFLGGRVDTALAWTARAIATAEQIGRANDLAIALLFKGTLHQWRGELEELAAQGRRAIEICERQGFPHLKVIGERHVARAAVGRGAPDAEVHVLALERGHLELLRMNVRIGQTVAMGTIAESWALLGKRDSALHWAEQGVRVAAESLERFFEPELLRIRGALLPSAEERVRSLEQALARAREHGSHWWALRAAADLAECRCAPPPVRAAAAERLRALLGGIREGEGLAELARARALAACD